MTDTATSTGAGAAPAGTGISDPAWFALPATEVADRLGVDPGSGLSAAKAAELLATNGPNALPAEKPAPSWRNARRTPETTARTSREVRGPAGKAEGRSPPLWQAQGPSSRNASRMSKQPPFGRRHASAGRSRRMRGE